MCEKSFLCALHKMFLCSFGVLQCENSFIQIEIGTPAHSMMKPSPTLIKGKPSKVNMYLYLFVESTKTELRMAFSTASLAETE